MGCLLRLSGHDFMDFRSNAGRGGSDGCINFEDEDNKGLIQCVTKDWANNDHTV